MNDVPEAGTPSGPDGLEPRTRLLLDCLFPDADAAQRWLDRDNRTLGAAPRRLIAQGRQREVQRYLAGWLLPVGPPPVPFARILESEGPSAG